MNAIHNERVKLTATALNNTGIAAVVTGMVAPVASTLYGTTILIRPFWWLIAAAWSSGGVAPHIGARWGLGSLRQ